MGLLKTALNAAVMVVSGKLASDGFEKAKATLKERKEKKASQGDDPKPVGSVTQDEAEHDDAE